MTTTAAVIGAGTMGVGIVYSLVTHGVATTVVEPDRARVLRVQEQLREVADEGIARSKLTPADVDAALGRLVFAGAISEIPEGLDVIIETIPEDLVMKREVLAQAEATRPSILASNTSTLSIDDLSHSLQHPAQFAGAHFFNPVWSINLVEVIRGSATSEETIQALTSLAEKIGKQTAVVNDSPGFATSRLDLVASLEAIRMVEAGVASPADIDRAISLAYRHPVGPLKLSDIVGLDVRLDTAEQLATRLGPQFNPPPLLVAMVNRGELGQKTGQGFYSWI